MCPNASRRNFTTGTEVLSEFQQEPKQIQMRAEPSLRVCPMSSVHRGAQTYVILDVSRPIFITLVGILGKPLKERRYFSSLI